MKCRSVACIWSDSPPVHKVTATAVLNHPATLYTGGFDGSIIWWNLPTSAQTNQEVKPIATLCGHAAPIADLGICFPSAASGDGKLNDTTNVQSSWNSQNCGALFSVCKDGVMCVWSRTSGHCRRRRKMPPWVGSPSMVQPLPENRRYVCIACTYADSVHLSDHQSLDGENEVLADGESHYTKSSRCTIVVVDSYTLSTVQTVFHGNLSIGPLKSMAIILSTRQIEKQSVMLIDSCGMVQLLPILKDSDLDGENASHIQKTSSHLDMKDGSDATEQRGLLVACASRGQLLALVYTAYCTFRLVDDGNKIGEVVFLDDELCVKGKSYVIGGTFLGDDDGGLMQDSGESGDVFSEKLVVWNNRGSAAAYRIFYSSNLFKSEPLFAIPAVSHPPDTKLSISFVQANNYLLSIDSIGFHIEEPLLWRPYITVWLPPHEPNDKYYGECKRLGEGGFFDNWIWNSASRMGGFTNDISLRATTLEGETSSSNNSENISARNTRYLLDNSEKFVSSSMVISENCYVPFALVYGFCDGDIEVVRLDMFFEGFGYHSGSPHHRENSSASRQCLSGHTGAVLCLAAHRMESVSAKLNCNHVLISGSMDCTVRIWDLDSISPILVMHQHVAPVRQIIFPPPQTECPWSNCFLSVAEDSCVALTSIDTLQVERMFPGHPYYPETVVWDSARGYIACLCTNHSGIQDTHNVLYIWDVKTGARERVIRGAAAHSMFNHFCTGIKRKYFSSDGLMKGNTSASSLILSVIEETESTQSHLKYPVKGISSSITVPVSTSVTESSRSLAQAGKGMGIESILSIGSTVERKKPVIEGSCPFPGIATLSFDLKSMMSLCQGPEFFKTRGDPKHHQNIIGVETPKDAAQQKGDIHLKDQVTEVPSPHQVSEDGNSDFSGTPTAMTADYEWVRWLEECLLQFALSLLHFWNVDHELDNLLVTEMKLKRPETFNVAPGLIGDRGSLTVTFPGSCATLELWKSSPEYCAVRSLTMVSLAQHMIGLSHSYSAPCSALAAFYTRNFAEKIPDIKAPLLQLLVSFWQDEFEHVKMAARSLFHCAASRAIPRPLWNQKVNGQESLLGTSNGLAEHEPANPINKKVLNSPSFNREPEMQGHSQTEESDILSWLESFDVQDWISCVGGTTQDAMTSHIIVAAALAVWYPSIVKPNIAVLTVQSLIKLVMAMNEKYSSTAAEILAEGMESTWRVCIGSEIPHLIRDIFFQIECVSGASAKVSAQNSAASLNIKETLVGILLPSLAMADIPGFLNVIESQIWSTASDSPVHVISLMTLIRVVRGSPRSLAQYLDKVVTFILQTMDPSNTVMRRTCIQSSMVALKELVRVFPMVALNETSTRLAVGDAIADIKSAIIRIYDMQSMTKVKVLDASGPPGLPGLLGGASEMGVTTAISALSFSPDGGGLVAFSENGLMIRWWSLGSVWWEKISRNLTPIQCTKLIFVPPWEGFSPSSTRSSIMASVTSDFELINSQVNKNASGEMDRLKLLIHNLDLSYRLQWAGERKVKLTQHGHELGIFLLYA